MVTALKPMCAIKFQKSGCGWGLGSGAATITASTGPNKYSNGAPSSSGVLGSRPRPIKTWALSLVSKTQTAPRSAASAPTSRLTAALASCVKLNIGNAQRMGPGIFWSKVHSDQKIPISPYFTPWASFFRSGEAKASTIPIPIDQRPMVLKTSSEVAKALAGSVT